MKPFTLPILIGLIALCTALSAQNTTFPLIINELTKYNVHVLEQLDGLQGKELLAALNEASQKIEAIDIVGNSFTKGRFKYKKHLSEEELNELDLLDEYISTPGAVGSTWNEMCDIPTLFFVWGAPKTIELTVTGDFTDLNTDQVYLSYYGVGKVTPTSLTNNTATFRFDPNVLIKDPTAEAIGYNMLELNKVSGSGKKMKHDKVRFLIGHYPDSFGTVKISSAGSTSSEKEVEHKRTRTFLLNAFKEDLVDKLCTPSHSGWKVISSSIELVIESSTGVKNRDWNYRKVGSGTKTCYQIEVFNNSAGSSGKLEYYLKYDIERSVEVSSEGSSSETKVSVGDQFELKLTNNATVSWTLPNGEELKITEQSIPSIPGVQLSIKDGSLVIDADILP